MNQNFKDIKWLAVVNPVSGGGRAKKKWNKVIKAKLEEIGVNFTEYITEAPQDAIYKTVEEIDNYDGFIAIGGDGVCNEVLNGILKGTIDQNKPNNKLFAIIPAGTGNDIAKAFEMPHKDIEASCDLFKPEMGNKRVVDSGKAMGTDFDDVETSRYFCGVLSAGFDAEVAYKTNNGSKWVPGTTNYIKALLTTIIRLRSREFQVDIINGEENEAFSKKGILIAIGLGAYYGAGMKICPDALVDDGLFHITFVNRIARRTLLRFFPKIYDGKHVTHKAVELYIGTEITLNIDNDCYWQVDGEIIGFTPVKIKSIPKVLNVLVPLSKDEA